MRARASLAGLALAGALLAGCSWGGVNSLPLPGTKGHGDGSYTVQIQMPDVQTITQNSPVMVNDVTVGSVTDIETQGWHALVTVSLDRDVYLPHNATAMIAQTSLLGSEHVELAPPAGVAPVGTLHGGDVIPLQRAGAYPTTERTLTALATVLNGGGLGQLHTITTELNAAFDGRDKPIHDLIGQVNTLVDTLNRQRGAIVSTIDNLNRFSGIVDRDSATLTKALDTVDPALRTLNDERHDFTAAMQSLTRLSDQGTALIHRSGDDLEANLKSLKVTLTHLSQAGDSVIDNLGTITTFPFPQVTIDNAMRGDYTNLWAVLDLTIPRLRTDTLHGTPLGAPIKVSSSRPVGSQPANPFTAPIEAAGGGGR